jgi:hypothetical protein
MSTPSQPLKRPALGIRRPGCRGGVQLVRVVEDRRLGRPRRPKVVVGADRVEELGAGLRVEVVGSLLDHPQAEMDVSEEATLVRRREQRPAIELSDTADVVKECGGEHEVGAEPGMDNRCLTTERRHVHGVLEQTACVAVMTIGRRRELAQATSELGVADESSDDGAQPSVGDLLSEELEEAVELVEVASGLGHQRHWIHLGLLERAHLELEAVAEALDAPENADGIAHVEPAIDQLDVVPDAGVDPTTSVEQLEREVRCTAPGAQALLPRDGEHLLDDPILFELRDRDGRGHGGSLGRAPDARLAAK